MSILSDTFRRNKAICSARVEARANIKAGDIVTVSGVDGEWKVWSVDGESLTVVKQKDGRNWQGLRDFSRSRCTPVGAPSLSR